MADVWTTYCLVTRTGRNTYVGATVDLERRLAQHNGFLAGGAGATAMRGRGAWIRAAHVRGFPDKRAAFQFEWRWKRLSRTKERLSRIRDPLRRRMDALAALLLLERPTRSARPYGEYPQGISVVLETEAASCAWTQPQLPPFVATICFPAPP